MAEKKENTAVSQTLALNSNAYFRGVSHPRTPVDYMLDAFFDRQILESLQCYDSARRTLDGRASGVTGWLAGWLAHLFTSVGCPSFFTTKPRLVGRFSCAVFGG